MAVHGPEFPANSTGENFEKSIDIFSTHRFIQAHIDRVIGIIAED